MCTRGRSTNRLGPFKYSERRSATVLAHHMKSLKNIEDNCSDRAHVFPTGSIFVTENVLKGVLPQILDEMLSTRSMLKKVAKEYRHRFHEVSPAVLRQLEARQLALKYVANVTCTSLRLFILNTQHHRFLLSFILSFRWIYFGDFFRSMRYANIG